MGKRKVKVVPVGLPSMSEAEAQANFKRALQAGNVVLSPQAAATLKAAGITLDDMIALLLKDCKGLQ